MGDNGEGMDVFRTIKLGPVSNILSVTERTMTSGSAKKSCSLDLFI